MKSAILNKLQNKDATIGIIGLGYVGLPLVLLFCEQAFKVIGFDVDESRVEALSKADSFIEHIPDAEIAKALDAGFVPTTDYSQISDVDVIIICVPTPLSKHREPDLSYVTNTVDSLLPYMKKGQVISLESTTYPGTTEEVLQPKIEAKGFKVGQDVFLIYSPEREDPGNKEFTTRDIPKVCGGTTQDCLEIGQQLYSSIIHSVVPVSSTKAAELTKLLENIHRAVNIGLVNEMKIVSDQMGIDIHEVIDAAATKPFGFVPYKPGPGLGGHCIPIDPFYLTWKAREYGVHTKFIEIAGEVNSKMPDYVISKIFDALNKHKKSINGSKILILGLAYKKNVDDTRESPSIHIMEKLFELGADIHYSDSHVPSFPWYRSAILSELEHVKLSPASIAEFDCLVITTDHDDVDYQMLKDNGKIIIDTRGVYKGEFDNIVKA